MSKKDPTHYVDKKKFSQAVVEYSTTPPEKRSLRLENYVGDCILKICTKLASAPNFTRYSFKDEMISCAIIRCTIAINNFDPTADTRSGELNAHSYFSTVAYWEMVNKIKSENAKHAKKLDYVLNSGIEAFIADGSREDQEVARAYIDSLKSLTSEHVSEKEKNKTKHYGFSPPQRKRKKKAEPGLTEFMKDENVHSGD